MQKIACITGDVHHPLSPSVWDKHEHEYAREYCEILKSSDVKGTIFVTGKMIELHPNTFRKISEMEGIELGGHTYTAFTTLPFLILNQTLTLPLKGKMYHVSLNSFLHCAFSLIFDSFYGPEVLSEI